MNIQIRQGVFETNSSNTHVLTLFSKEDWKKYQNGDLLRLRRCENEFITKKEAIKHLNKNIVAGINTLKEEQTKNPNKEVTIKGSFDNDLTLSQIEDIYKELDKNDYDRICNFVKRYGKCQFGPLPADYDDYREFYEYLEHDVGHQEIGGKKIYYEVFHGRDG